MTKNVLVTVVLDKTTVEMLAELAGDKSAVASYLTLLITKLHAERQGQDSDRVLETLTKKMQAPYEHHIAAQRKIRVLSKRITDIISSYQELLAVVALLTDDLPAHTINISTHTNRAHSH